MKKKKIFQLDFDPSELMDRNQLKSITGGWFYTCGTFPISCGWDNFCVSLSYGGSCDGCSDWRYDSQCPPD